MHNNKEKQWYSCSVVTMLPLSIYFSLSSDENQRPPNRIWEITNEFYFIWFNCLENRQFESFTIISMMLCVIFVRMLPHFNRNACQWRWKCLKFINSAAHLHRCAFWRVKDSFAVFFSENELKSSLYAAATVWYTMTFVHSLNNREISYFFSRPLAIFVQFIVFWFGSLLHWVNGLWT